MLTLNKIACEPFADNSVKTELHGEGAVKVLTVTNTKSTLAKLKVVYDGIYTVNGHTTRIVAPGSYVYVRASDYATPWGKEVLSVEGTRFIMVPFERVEVYE